MTEFEAWARPFRRRNAREKGQRLVVKTLKEMLKDNELCRLFICSLLRKKVGFSVPRAARRFLSNARKRLGLQTLNLDEQLRDNITGYERSMPRTVVQALSLDVDDIQRISEKWGAATTWWEVQSASLMALGFVGILRLAEVRALKIRDVHVVFWDGREVALNELGSVPRLAKVKGLFIHLRWRKASQSHDTWIPVACPVVIRLLFRHTLLLRRDGKRSGPLFTSRTRVGGRRSPNNCVGHRAAVEAMRRALREVCAMSNEQALLYKGHSLRVGGSNHIRKLGISHEVHRIMGGWASLVSSSKYFQLSEDEQLGHAEAYALKERAPPSEEGARLIAMEAVRGITIND